MSNDRTSDTGPIEGGREQITDKYVVKNSLPEPVGDAESTGPFSPNTDVNFVSSAPLQGARIPVLLPLRGPTPEKLYILDRQETWIGRSPEAEIHLKDHLVSRLHARIIWENSTRPTEFPRCVLIDGGSRNGTFVNRRRVNSEPLSDGDRIVIGATLFAFLVKDTLELDYDSRVLHRATTDSLTFVSSRVAFEEAAVQAMAIAERQQHPLTLCLLDIDRFKQINDELGHLTGDHVLRHLASLILRSVRNSDMVGRLGGDEFAVLLVGTDAEATLPVMHQLCATVAVTPCTGVGEALNYTVSIGVAQMTKEHRTWSDLMHAADQQLYEAKHRGRGQVCGG